MKKLSRSLLYFHPYDVNWNNDYEAEILGVFPDLESKHPWETLQRIVQHYVSEKSFEWMFVSQCVHYLIKHVPGSTLSTSSSAAAAAAAGSPRGERDNSLYLAIKDFVEKLKHE